MPRLLVLLALSAGCSGFERTTQPPVPRLIAPLSTAMVNVRRPTLRFALPATLTAPAVDVCSSRSCDGAITHATISDSGDSASPDQDLTSGHWFWRVRASSPSGGVTSAVWQLRVAAQTGGPETSWGSELDLDGDGFAELAVGAPDTALFGGPTGDGRVYIYAGASGGPDRSHVTVLDAPEPSGEFGRALAAVDFDGDGFVDLAVAAPQLGVAGSGHRGVVYVFRGGPHGVGPAPDFTLSADGADDFGGSIDNAGDPNGDGFGDLVIGAPTSNVAGPLAGAAFILYGGRLASNSYAPLEPEADSMAQVGWSVSGGSDLDGDGLDDVVVGAPGSPGGARQGRAYIYRGYRLGIDGMPIVLDVGAPPRAAFGFSLASLGDTDGDGIGDLAVGSVADGPGRVYLFKGGSTPSLLRRLDGPDGDGGNFGASLAAGDGELAIGAPCAPPGPNCSGLAYVSTATGLSALPAPANAMSYGGALAIGDHDGDGHADLAVASSEIANGLGRVDWYRAGSTTPDVILNGSDPAGRFGAAVR